MHQLFQIAIYQASTSSLKKVAKDDVKEAWTFYHFCEKFQNDTIVLILQECDLNKHNIPDSKHILLDLAKGETHKFGKANVEGVLTNTNNGMFWRIKKAENKCRGGIYMLCNKRNKTGTFQSKKVDIQGVWGKANPDAHKMWPIQMDVENVVRSKDVWSDIFRCASISWIHVGEWVTH